MTLTTAVTTSGVAEIDALLMEYRWSGPSITFGFPTLASQYDAAINTGNFAPATDKQAAAVRAAFESVESFTNLDFIELIANPGDAVIRYGGSNIPTQRDLFGGNGTARGPGEATADGDGWLGDGLDADFGEVGWAIFWHEAGHSLGLRHPFEVEPLSNAALSLAWDTPEFTIMTYRPYEGGSYMVTNNKGELVPATWPGVRDFPQSFMMLDIAALQHMYGADFTHNNTATTYTFDPNTSSYKINGVPTTPATEDIYQPLPLDDRLINRLFLTIWDGGGIDTYDFSLYGATRQLDIDLRPGRWTDVDRDSNWQAADLGGGPHGAGGGYARGQVFNALLYRPAPDQPYDLRSLIEHAIGGRADDIITGNQVANHLQGRGGNDTLRGFSGFDTLDGGEGRDMASYALAAGAVTIDLQLARAAIAGAGGFDFFISIEDAEGSDFDDLIIGSAAPDKLYGGKGNDVFRPGAGVDFVFGGDGLFDLVSYDTSPTGIWLDRESGFAGGGHLEGDIFAEVERFAGSNHADTMRGAQGLGDWLSGNDGNDLLEGRGGNDTLLGGKGIDTLIGGAGADSLDGGDDYDGAWFGGAFVAINLTTGIHGGEAAGDTFVRIEGFLGTAGNDTMVGNGAAHDFYGADGDDSLSGLGGNDKLFGGLGNDILEGGEGDDSLYGGGGDDEYWGGNGFDLVSFADLAAPVLIDFAPGPFGSILNPLKLVSIEDIEGTGFADEIWGRAGEANYFRGGAGNDTIGGRGDGDVISGEQGDDVIVVAGFELSVNGDGGAAVGNFDTLKVGGGAGVFNWATNSFAVDGKGIFQVVGFEMARGAGGNDSFTANWENLSFYGEGGNDTLTGGNGDNVLEGGDGADTLFFGGGFDYADYRSDTAGVLVDIRSGLRLFGHAAGDVWLDAPEAILASAGNDSLGGSDGDNLLRGRAGDDYISGYAGQDSLQGEEGNDSIEGGLGADIVNGGDGDDHLVDTEGLVLPPAPDDNADDSLFGGNGNDRIVAGGGSDLLDGGADDDTLTGGEGADSILGGTGNDVLADHTQVADASGALLSGAYAATDADTLLGGAGVDLILSSGGGDLINGGADIDNLLMDFTAQSAALVFTMAGGSTPWTMTLGGVVTATVSNIETILISAGSGRDLMTASAASFYVVLDGGAGNDVVRGGASGDVLMGSAGNDKLFGNGGDDLLVGNAGRDTMVGGAGIDTFRWDVASEGKDVIQGFVSGEDRLQVDASGFKGGLKENMDLAATGRFVVDSGPTAARGQFLYDTALATLSWDRDGTGAATAQLIATFDAGIIVAAGDIVVVA